MAALALLGAEQTRWDPLLAVAVAVAVAVADRWRLVRWCPGRAQGTSAIDPWTFDWTPLRRFPVC